MPSVPEELKKYMLHVDIRYDDVPVEVYVAFPESLEDENVRKKLREAWLSGNRYHYVALKLMKTNVTEMVFRPLRVEINWRLGDVALVPPCQIPVLLPKTVVWSLGNDIEDICRTFNDYLYVRAVKREKKLFAAEIKPLKATVDREKAREILDKVPLSPAEILVYGLGIEANAKMLQLYIPRLLSWFKGEDGRPLHIAQFTLPNTGKTTFGLRCETIWNWEYFNEVPTLPRLVMDARGGRLGSVFLRDGLIFDEFDKWGLMRNRVEQLYEVLLTGMEQGKWTRGTTSAFASVPDIPRLIPVLFFGNLGALAEYWTEEAPLRAAFNAYFSSQVGVDLRPLSDRLTVIDVQTEELNVSDHVTNYVLPDAVIRGLILELQERVEWLNESTLKGRLWRHSVNVYSILKTLGLRVDAKTIDRYILGVKSAGKTGVFNRG